MRRIKCRAYYEPLNKMFYNCYRKPKVKDDKLTGFLWMTLKNGRPFALEDDCTTIMQYIGLKDKNVKEIYQKDILKINAWASIRIGYVEWYQGKHVIEIPSKSLVYNISDWFKGKEKNSSDIEKLGNIFENLDLLKEGNNV